LLNSGRVELAYIERWGDEDARKKKAASKTKYTCGGCGLNAWAKLGVRLVCGTCDQELQAEGQEEEGEGED
jgi:hypothetical protein